MRRQKLTKWPDIVRLLSINGQRPACKIFFDPTRWIYSSIIEILEFSKINLKEALIDQVLKVKS